MQLKTPISLAARPIWSVLNLDFRGAQWGFDGFCIFETCSFKIRRMTPCHPWAKLIIQDGVQDGFQNKVGYIKQPTDGVISIIPNLKLLKCMAEMLNIVIVQNLMPWISNLWSKMAIKMDIVCFKQAFHWFSIQPCDMFLREGPSEVLTVFVSVSHALSKSGGWHLVILGQNTLFKMASKMASKKR